ncbi:hypothetical protein [Caldisericum exile]|uniref:DUF4870 domain-containing protein n=1 Tax=Caldisericum exile (strain DSM 21853 / NBRC 104410 / AZM16c01) TaxID=511051 RepID=A0A7U6JFV7_CALEA|nr:hypothetical protein [Caldisericum exile]BAL80660.1 hypothetical protein CSE_05340 [Caldisericum exile AZM16c01]
MEELKDFDPKDIEENKVLASLSYISILFIIPLLVKRDSKFCVEHAKQGLVLFLIEVALGIINWIPIIGWIIGSLGGIVLFVVSLLGFIYAIQGKFWKIPGVYDLAQNFKF